MEAVCGSADNFFTSVFSAQGNRPRSTYRNAETTARLLKAGLSTIRQELAGLRRALQFRGREHPVVKKHIKHRCAEHENHKTLAMYRLAVYIFRSGEG